MSISRTAYDTVATRGYQIKRTAEAVEVAYSFGDLNVKHNDSGAAAAFVEGGRSSADNIPAFAHPLLIENKGSAPYVVGDVRNYGVWDKMQDSFHVRNQYEYDMQVLRTKLNWIWVTQSANILRDISTVPMAVYSAWISETLGRHCMLNPQEQLTVAILSAYFYACQFIEASEEIDKQDKFKIAGQIARATGIRAEDVLDTIEDIPQIKDASYFAAMLHEVTGAVRLRDLNVGVLYGYLGSTWWGTNSKELVAVAVEHPPTWLAILYAAFNSRTFKNAQITKIAEVRNKRDAGPNYIRSLVKLVQDFGL